MWCQPAAMRPARYGTAGVWRGTSPFAAGSHMMQRYGSFSCACVRHIGCDVPGMKLTAAAAASSSGSSAEGMAGMALLHLLSAEPYKNQSSNHMQGEQLTVVPA